MLRIYMVFRPVIKFFMILSVSIRAIVLFPYRLFMLADIREKTFHIIVYLGTAFLCYFFPVARLVTIILCCVILVRLVKLFTVDFAKYERENNERYGLFYGLSQTEAMRLFVMLMESYRLGKKDADLDRIKIINDQYRRYLEMNR